MGCWPRAIVSINVIDPGGQDRACPREDARGRAVSMFAGVSRRGHVLISVCYLQRTGRGKKPRRGPRLNVPNVNYASGVPAPVPSPGPWS